MMNNQESNHGETPNPGLISWAKSSPKDSSQNSHASVGIAVTSFVLGLVSLLLSFFVIGVIFGIVGLVFGIVHLGKRMPLFKAMAVWGIVLSLIGSVANIGFGVFYGIKMHRMYVLMKEIQSEGEMQPQAEEYIGVVSPDIDLTDMDGNEITLSKLKGKRVILYFWATWCPPCKKEIPHFIKLADEVKTDKLVIIGISSEDKSTLQKFIKKIGINYPIASADNLPSPFFGISSIPTTFFIDSNGIIQNVLVGYHDYDTLKANATAENYKGEPKTAPAQPKSGLKDSEIKYTLKPQWTLNIPDAVAICAGNWGADGKEKILVAGRNGILHTINKEGVIENDIKIPDTFSQIEIGKSKQHGCMLLGYSNWGQKVTVVDMNGRQLWVYPTRYGVNGAHWGDLDGDNNDEMIIGMNGFGGLHAVSCDGKLIWKVSDIGNVWNQAVVIGRDPQNTLVFATEAGGTIHVYDSNGQKLRILHPYGKYYTQMTASLIDANDDIQIVAIGSDGTIAAFNPVGKIAWTTNSPKQRSWRTTNFACGDIEGDGRKDWAFFEANGDLAVAAADGTKLASLPAKKNIEGFLICSGLSGGELITMSKGTISSYSLSK
jgi:peroxiredoxin